MNCQGFETKKISLGYKAPSKPGEGCEVPAPPTAGHAHLRLTDHPVPDIGPPRHARHTTTFWPPHPCPQHRPFPDNGAISRPYPSQHPTTIPFLQITLFCPSPRHCQPHHTIHSVHIVPLRAHGGGGWRSNEISYENTVKAK